MIRQTRELLAPLSKLNQPAPNVVLGIMDGGLCSQADARLGGRPAFKAGWP